LPRVFCTSLAINKIEFEVVGQPVGKARPRFTKFGHVYTPAKTKDYEARLTAAAWSAMKAKKLEKTEKAVHLEVEAHMEIPSSWSKVKTLEAQFGAIRPTTKPDIDNILKCVGDAIEKAGVVENDKQIYSVKATKKYADTETGAKIYISVSWPNGTE